jgi:hypothetical protein
MKKQDLPRRLIPSMEEHLKKLHLRLPRRFIITTLSAVAVGVLLFIGAQLDTLSTKEISAIVNKNQKKPGKYAYENSPKAKFISGERT